MTNELSYRSYAWNRMMFPEISPERWAAIYGPVVVDFEERFLNTFIEKLKAENESGLSTSHFEGAQCENGGCPNVGAGVLPSSEKGSPREIEVAAQDQPSRPINSCVGNGGEGFSLAPSPSEKLTKAVIYEGGMGVVANQKPPANMNCDTQKFNQNSDANGGDSVSPDAPKIPHSLTITPLQVGHLRSEKRKFQFDDFCFECKIELDCAVKGGCLKELNQEDQLLSGDYFPYQKSVDKALGRPDPNEPDPDLCQECDRPESMCICDLGGYHDPAEDRHFA